MNAATSSLLKACLLYTSIRASLVAAQQCWYPDQQTVATGDVPCDANATVSPCCNPDAFCLGNGLCFGSGILSRGSCTDQSWGDECTQYCQSTNPSGGAVITPCTDTHDFTCTTCADSGSNFALSGADTIVLRAYQVAPLQSPSSASPLTLAPTGILSAAQAVVSTGTNSARSGATVTVTTTASPSGTGASSAAFTGGDVAGAAVGAGLPLLIALGAALFIIFRQRKQLRQISQDSAYDPGVHSQSEKRGFVDPSQVPLQAPTPHGQGTSSPYSTATTAYFSNPPIQPSQHHVHPPPLSELGGAEAAEMDTHK